MQLSVIIPCLNEADNIRAAANSAWRAGADEVIVADGGSGDSTVQDAIDVGCTVVHSEPSRGAQQSAAAMRATGDVLLFLHADNRLPNGAKNQIQVALTDRRIVGGSFHQRINAEGWLYRLIERGNAFRADRLQTPYGDQAIFVRRESFDRAGGFPDEPLFEDVIIARRLRRLGTLILLAGPIEVDARRWQKHGTIRQTLRNWTLVTLFNLGVSPKQLAHFYRRRPSFARSLEPSHSV